MASAAALPSNLTAGKTDQKSQQTPTKVSAISSAGASSGLTQQQSPRNTSTGGAPSGTCVQWGPVEVSKPLQDGEKFVKWDDVSQQFIFNLLLLGRDVCHYPLLSMPVIYACTPYRPTP